MARVRVHQHVNPLAKFYRELPVEPLDIAAIYKNPDLPIHIDIGCGRGRFLLTMAGANPERNFLGVEIREPLVDEANEIRKLRGLNNLHYSFCNAPLDLGKLLEDTPKKLVTIMTIQFPDPWFKKRHAKRRMVNEELVSLIDENLSDDGCVFVQTDVAEVAEEISEHFQNGGFSMEAVAENTLQVATEREVSVESRGLEVFRMLFLKNSGV